MHYLFLISLVIIGWQPYFASSSSQEEPRKQHPFIGSAKSRRSPKEDEKLKAEISKDLLSCLMVYNKNLETLPLPTPQQTAIFAYKNRITDLPVDLTNFRNVTFLDLAYNALRSLPTTITQMVNLIWLDVQYNQLQTLPCEMKELKNLFYLDISGNPIKDHTKILSLQGLFKVEISTPPTSPASVRLSKSKSHELQQEQHKKYPAIPTWQKGAVPSSL